MATLIPYGFDFNSMKLIASFLSGKKFSMKIHLDYLDYIPPYLNLIVGVPQELILSPLLFKIYMYDLFLCDCESNIINYVDNTTLYVCETNMDLILSKLEKDPFTAFTWFQNNYLKANSGKSHLLITFDNILHVNVGGINPV